MQNFKKIKNIKEKIQKAVSDKEALELKCKLLEMLDINKVEEREKLALEIIADLKDEQETSIWFRIQTILLRIYRSTGQHKKCFELGVNLKSRLGNNIDLKSNFFIHNSLVNSYLIKRDWEKAFQISEYIKLNLYDVLSDDLKANYHHELGRVYQKKTFIDLAIDEYQAALKLFISAEDDIGYTKILNSIGVLHFYKADYKKALTFFLKSLEKHQENSKDFVFGLARDHANIEHCYTYLCQYEKADLHYKKALSLAKEANNMVFYNRHLSTHVQGIIEKGEGKKGIELALNLLKKKENREDKFIYWNLISALGDGYSNIKDYKNAIKYLKMYYEYIESIGLVDQAVIKMKFLAENYKAQGDMHNSVLCYEKYIQLSEELKERNKKNTLEQFQMKFQTFENEKEIQNLKHESTAFQLQSLRAQMNPHFVFNSIASISSTLKPNNIDNSKTLLHSFARLMRANLEFAELEKISLENEIQFLNDYLKLEKNRLGEKLNFEINYTEDIDFIEIPSMIIQPYIENAIKHGIVNSKNNGLIKITFEEKDDFLICTIEDNGIGRNAAEKLSKNNKKHLGKSTTINAKRLKLLNNNSKKQVVVSYQDLRDKKDVALGTKVILKISLH
ncbi:MAG: tetratricopeptide repeat-containing sensor histidine kinase [Chitinophagales bacterium]